MRIVDLKIKNFYSCQFCGKVFESPKEFKINPGVYPNCCTRCDFKVLFRIIKNLGYSEENLRVCLDFLKIKPKYTEENKLELNFAYFELTKYFIKKIDLSSINYDIFKPVHKPVHKKPVQECEPENLLKKPVHSKSLYNKDLNRFEQEQVLVQRTEQKEVLRKWF
jgi:DNA-directed RNA polymerase subunit RPC12/RpoP